MNQSFGTSEQYIDRQAAIDSIRGALYPLNTSQISLFERNPFSDYKRDEIFAQAEALVAVADDQTVCDAVDLLALQSIGGIEPAKTLGRGHPDKLGQLWNIFVRQPDTARALIGNRIVGFHGTRSGALWGIIRQGYIQSAVDSEHRHTPVTTGERTMAPSDGHDFVFFGDLGSPETIAEYTSRQGPRNLEVMRNQLYELWDNLDNWNGPVWQKPIMDRIAKNLNDEIEFIELNPHSIDARLKLANFPVAIGLSIEGFDTYRTPGDVPAERVARQNALIEFPYPYSDINGEFAIERRVAVDRAPVVAAPEENVGWLRHIISLSKAPGLQVIPDDLLRLRRWEMPQLQFVQ